MRYAWGIAIILSLALVPAYAQSQTPYTQQKDLVYGQVHGIGLLMDVFTPNGDSNGHGIVDIASGAWHSDRGKIRDHQVAMMYQNFCQRGYTVFAIRPGSVTRFTGEDMLENVNLAIRYIKSKADEYGIDPDRLGLVGASAGAHLAAMTVAKAEDGNPKAKDELERLDTRVAAVGIFFPPTNFLQWGDGPTDLNLIGNLLFPGGVNGHDEAAVRAKAEAMSPALQFTQKTPPFLIWHGDADPVVPLQQSEFLVEKLRAVGTEVEFHVKKGGGHPWITIPVEVKQMAEWFDATLVGGASGG